MTNAASLLPVLTNCTISWWEYCTTTGNTLLFTGQSTNYYIGAGSSSARLYDYRIGSSGITMYRDGEIVSTTYNYPEVDHPDVFHIQNEWHHFVMTGLTFEEWSAFHINSYAASWPLNAYLSDIRIYATPLSASDVKELYHSSAHIDNTGKIYTYQIVEE